MEALQDYYNQKIYGISKTRLKKLLKIAGDVRGLKILDIGCGNGYLGKFFKDRGASIVHGCDISDQVVGEAENLLDRSFVFNIEKDDFDILDKDYDLIIATEIIEHLVFPDNFLKNISKIMSGQTEFILTTPNFLVWTNRIRMLLGKFEYRRSGFFDEGHLHFFSYRLLKKYLTKHNLRVVAEENVIHPKVPEWLGKLVPSLFVYQSVFKVKKI